MSQSKIAVTASIPHLQKEFNVELPPNTKAMAFYEALMKRVGGSENSNEGVVVYELFSKRLQKKLYPDFAHQTLAEIGVQPGDTIIMKKDMDPGAIG